MTHEGVPGRRLFSVVLVLLSGVSACTSWRPIRLGDRSLPTRIRVETTSRERIEIGHPTLQGDSAIVGTEVNSRAAVRVPLRDVVAISGRFADPTVKLLFLVGVAVIAGWAWAMMPST